MGLKCLLIFPPRAYPFMPYLAPYALKGYVERHSKHSVTCVDLNVSFFHLLWTGVFVESYANDISPLERNSRLIAEAVHHHGHDSWSQLRNLSLYRDGRLEAIGSHHFMLRKAVELARELDLARGVPRDVLPPGKLTWRTYLPSFRRSIEYAFLQKELYKLNLSAYDVVGISLAYMDQVPYGLLVAEEAKRISKRVKVVVGGNALTHLLHNVQQDPSFFHSLDFGIPFEGEITFLELLHSIESSAPTQTLRNILSIVDGRVRYEQDFNSRARAEVLPDFGDLHHLFPTPHPIYPLLTSKGCYWGKCTFCTHHEGYGEGYFPFSEQNLRQNVLQFTANGMSYFYFVDEALPPKAVYRFAGIMDNVQQQRGVQFRWMAECRIERTSANIEYVDRLQRSGCRFLISGIESGSPRVLSMMKKGVDLECVSRFAELCDAANIWTAWMFFVGFPGETEEEAQQTLSFLRDNANRVDFASIGSFSLERGSPIWDNPDTFGITVLSGQKRTYQLVYDYECAQSRRAVGRIDAKERLSSLLHRNADLIPLFKALPERCIPVFLDNKRSTRVDMQDLAFEWSSALLGKRVRLWPRGAFMQVL